MQTRLLGCGSRRKWTACAVGAVVVAVVMGAAFSLFANSTTALGDAAYSDSEKEAMDLRSECVYPFKTNELGMTYGTLDDAPNGQEPDLILARATNRRKNGMRPAPPMRLRASSVPRRPSWSQSQPRC